MKLNKLFLSSFAALVMVAGLSACSNGSYENHQFGFADTDGGVVMYADQTTDSTFVYSTDNWSFTCEADWLTARNGTQTAPFNVEVRPGYILQSRIDIQTTTNTTGKQRTAILTATSSADKVGSTYLGVLQYAWLNVSMPSTYTTNETTGITAFNMNEIQANGKQPGGATPYVAFTTYADGATLTIKNGQWLHFASDAATTFEKNKQQRIELTIDENKTSEARTDTLTLTSNGVTSLITVTQQGVK